MVRGGGSPTLDTGGRRRGRGLGRDGQRRRFPHPRHREEEEGEGTGQGWSGGPKISISGTHEYELSIGWVDDRLMVLVQLSLLHVIR